MSRLSLVLGLIMVCLFGVAEARDKKSYAMSMKVFKVIEQANLLMEEKQSEEALELLNKALEKRPSKYEKAQIRYLIGSYYYRLSDEPNALKYFELVLESKDGMPELLYKQALRTLVQMHMVQENYVKARENAMVLVTVGEIPDAGNYALLAQANYKLEKWQEALDAANSALELEKLAGKDPSENLLLLANAVYFETKAMDKMIGTLELLVRYYPKASYLLYLSSVYGQLEQQDKQTALMESLYENGYLKEGSQLRNLASLYIAEKVPYKGAMVLQDAIEKEKVEGSVRNYEMLAQAWRLAAENDKAILALDSAAKLSDDGDLYLRKGYLLFDKAMYKEAKKAVHQALDKGVDDEKKGEAWLLLGMSRFNLKEFTDAIVACEKASEYDSSKKLAKSWISYISTEERKYNSMLAE